jgi:alkanesulfonate monooxygenase SsuD/methylene tetrahydromethanopterin reductase-like flavin-dependent oxidoreductase (luciferase family)
MSPQSAPGPLFSLFMPQMRMSFETILDKAQTVERVGFDGIALMDHLAPPGVPGTAMYDGFVTAAAIAMRTERIRIAHLVLCASFRHPAVLAKEAVSIDHLSGGRFDLGIGWGSVPDELERFDCNNEPPAVRSARMAETLEVLTKLFSGEAFDHDGRFWHMRAAQQQPTPVNGTLPVIIGGGGPKLTMPLVARYADWWNCPSYSVDDLDALRPLVGRARISIQHPITIAANDAGLADIVGPARKRFGNWGGTIEGTPDVVAAALVDEARKGVEQFFVMFTDFASAASLELFGREVIPAVRAAVA